MLSQVIEDGQIVDSYFTADPLTLNTKNADALILGSSTTEGGDIKVYRDSFGNLQMSLDADAASNAEALVIYGGVVTQNYLTVGQATLNTLAPLFIHGNIRTDAQIIAATSIYGGEIFTSIGVRSRTDNQSGLTYNINITGTDAGNHTQKIQIDSNDIIVVQATGDGAGGITNPSIGLYPGTTPVTQAAAISNPAESTASNNAAIDSILAALRGIGLIAT